MNEKQPLVSDRPVRGQKTEQDANPRTPKKSDFTLRLLIASLLIIWSSIHLWRQGAFDALLPNRRGESHHTRAIRILKSHPLIDGHNDLLITIRAFNGNLINSDNFTHAFETGKNFPGQFSLASADKGHMGGAFWSAWLPCPTGADRLNFSDAVYHRYVHASLEQFDLFNRLAEKYPKYFTLASNAAEAKKNFYKEGKLVSPLIIEGLHQIGNSLSNLRTFHKLGVRYVTLNWNCHTKYTDAAVVEDEEGRSVASKPFWGGVSNPDGRNVILEMNRLGMIVDLAHVSEDTMRDVLAGGDGWKGSLAPPIFSHSSVKAICPHPRNVPDDVLHLVKKRNSVVMLTAVPDFISCKDVGSETGIPEYVEETNTIDQVVKHIVHVGELIGYDHIGLGTDFDGIPFGPRGFEDVSKFPDLVAKLLEKGISEKDVIKIIGGNLLRVWSEVDKVAAKLQREMNPIEDGNQGTKPLLDEETEHELATAGL